LYDKRVILVPFDYRARLYDKRVILVPFD